MINKVYLNSEVNSEMIEFFTQNGFIQLNNFLEEKFIKFKLNLLNENFKESFEPEFHKKKTLDIKEVYKFEVLEIIEFFKSKEFIAFVEDISECDIFLSKLEVNMYGKNDFVNYDNYSKREDIVSVIFDMTENWNDDTYGGSISYKTEKEEIFYLEPSSNTLSVMYKPSDVDRFLTKINDEAKNNKILRVEMEFSIEE